MPRTLTTPTRRGSAAALVAVLSASLLTACFPAPDESATLPTYAAAQPVPLPAGSSFHRGTGPEFAREGIGSQTCGWEGSLRPDAASVDERLPDVIARGRLVVGVDQQSNLMSFRDPVTGELAGFDIDLAREIARDIFGDPEAIEFRIVSAAQRASAVNDGLVDLIVRSMTITCEREDLVDFSAPYLTTGLRVLTLKSSAISRASELQHASVCAVTNSTTQSYLAEELPEATRLEVATWGDCLVALQQGQVTSVITDDVILAGIAEQDPYVHIVGPRLTTAYYGVAAADESSGRNSEALIRQVNQTLERIRVDGTFQELRNRWLSTLPAESMPAPVYRAEEE